MKMGEPKFYPFDQSPFYKLTSKKRLAELLGIEAADLRVFEKAGPSYKEWDEEKKSGGFRHIENPARPLKLLQRNIARRLSKIAPPDHLFCPVKRRSFVHNAKAHAGSRVVRTLDIKKYFPSTSSKRVFWFWHKRMKCASNIAGILTALSCWNGHLPTGSPLSPILSFYAHMDIWENIATIAKAAGCKITVYIDDVTISGDKVPDNLLWQIKREIKKANLVYHKEKTYRCGWSEVTGIIARDGKIKAPNRTLKALHELRKNIRREKDPQIREGIAKRLKSYETHIQQIEKINVST